MILALVTAATAADVLPLHDLKGPCQDRRYPVVMGEWVVGCGPSGKVDRAISLKDNVLIRLPVSADSVGFGDVPVFGRKGLFQWATLQLDTALRIIDPTVSPSFNRLDRIATLESDSVRLRKGAKSWSAPAQPRGWYPPALLGDQVVWVNDDGQGGSDLWAWQPGEVPRPYADGDGEQRHVVASHTHVAYLDSNNIVVKDLGENDTKVISATVVDRLSIWEDTVCWSAWSTNDIDVFCSNGFHLRRVGHQLWPSHSERGLVFQESGTTMLLSFEK